MAGRRNAKKEAQWRGRVERQEASGLSVRKFCRDESISENSFYAWRRELRLRDQQQSSVTERQSPASPERANATEFIPVKLLESPSAGMLELVHPLGYLLRVDGEVDPRSLSQVLDVLDARGNR